MTTTTTATTTMAEVSGNGSTGPATDPNTVSDGPKPVSTRDPAWARGLSMERLEAELIDVGHRLRCRTVDLLVLIGEFDDRGAWVRFGALSMAAWLADVCDIDIGTARSQVRVARAMREHPVLAEAVVSGRVSYAKARVIVPYLRDHNAADLVGLAGRYAARDLGAAIAAWSRRHEGDEERDQRHHRERRLSWRTDGDGMVCFTIRLPPAEAGKLIAVLDHTVITTTKPPAQTRDRGRASTDDHPRAGSEAGPEADSVGADVADAPAGASGPAPKPRAAAITDAPAGASLAQQRADALVQLTTGRAAVTVSTEMVIHLRGDLNTLADGTPITDHAVTALLPDAFISLLIHDMNRQPIDASPRRRTPTRRQRRILDQRHPTCAHPGCTARAFLQYDHIDPYSQGGPTTIENLQRLCGPHNRSRTASRR